MTTRTHPRLHVLLAKDNPMAVVIRRGPSRHHCVIGWNREDDTFKVAQWLCGRIYERRSDLSPDGKHFIYFATNNRLKSETKGAWTALSIAPYLKAIGLWTNCGTWYGGGLFINTKEYWLHGDTHDALSEPVNLKKKDAYPSCQSYGDIGRDVYYIRLQRDGWILTKPNDKKAYVAEFEKRISDQWKLIKFAYATTEHPVGRGIYYDEHLLYNIKTTKTISCEAWEWAEVDGDRIVWAEHGKLFAAHLGKNGLIRQKELHDFNNMVFEKLTAPY